MLTGQDGRGAPVRPVDTLALVQGALSLWSYCSGIPSEKNQAGFFRALPVGTG